MDPTLNPEFRTSAKWVGWISKICQNRSVRLVLCTHRVNAYINVWRWFCAKWNELSLKRDFGWSLVLVGLTLACIFIRRSIFFGFSVIIEGLSPIHRILDSPPCFSGIQCLWSVEYTHHSSSNIFPNFWRSLGSNLSVCISRHKASWDHTHNQSTTCSQGYV